MFRMHSDDREEIQTAEAGDIVAFYGVEASSGETFTDGKVNVTLTSMHVPAAVISLAVAPKDRAAEQNFSKALNRFTKEDPTFRVHQDEESQQTIISGMGELHLDIYMERMRREYSPPSTRGETYRTEDWHNLVTLTHQGPIARGTIRAYLNDGDADWFRRNVSGNADSLSSWRLSGIRWRENITPWPASTIVAGVDLDYDRGSLRTVGPAPSPPAVFPPMTMRLLSVYSGVNHSVTFRNGIKLTPSAGVRYYAHNEFNARWAPQAGVTLGRGSTELHLGGSRGINYPGLEVAAFSQVLIPALGRSWQMLRPEQADQFEAGVRHAINAKTSVAMSVFSNRIRNRYVIVFPPPPPPRYENLEAFRTDGLEISADAALHDGLGVFVAAALLRTRPGDIPYAPTRTLTGGLTWRVKQHWRLSLDGVYVSSMHAASEARVAGAGNPMTVGAHLLLNARVTRRFFWGARDVNTGEVYLSAENLTDRDFGYQSGYPIPGVNFMIGLRLKR
jgi:iron complex outermembrane receptor protein